MLEFQVGDDSDDLSNRLCRPSHNNKKRML